MYLPWDLDSPKDFIRISKCRCIIAPPPFILFQRAMKMICLFQNQTSTEEVVVRQLCSSRRTSLSSKTTRPTSRSLSLLDILHEIHFKDAIDLQETVLGCDVMTDDSVHMGDPTSPSVSLHWMFLSIIITPVLLKRRFWE